MTSGLNGRSTRRASEREFSYHETEDLRPHPFQIEVYGEEPVDQNLVESITINGILQPILYARMSFNEGDSYENYIVSGHRRWLVAKEIGLKKVPTIDFTAGDARSFKHRQPQLLVERRLIESNRQRVKTESQKDAEAFALLRIEKELAAERQQAGLRLTSAEGGKAVEKVAETTGESADTVRKRAEIHEAKIPAAERNRISTNKAFESLPKPSSCDICSEPFESKGAMKDHRNKVHAVEMARRREAHALTPPPVADSTSSAPTALPQDWRNVLRDILSYAGHKISSLPDADKKTVYVALETWVTNELGAETTSARKEEP